MRTGADLEAAFALIADDVEDTLASRRPATTRPVRRRWVATVAAAAVIAAGAFAAGRFAGDERAPAAGTPAARTQLLVLSLGENAHGIKIIGSGDASTLGLQVFFATVDGMKYEVDVAAEDYLESTRYPYPNTDIAKAEKVDLGAITGYLGCSGNSGDPPQCDPGSLTLAWKLPGNVWVQTYGSDTPAGRDQLLRLGRALTFRQP